MNQTSRPNLISFKALLLFFIYIELGLENFQEKYENDPTIK